MGGRSVVWVISSIHFPCAIPAVIRRVSGARLSRRAPVTTDREPRLTRRPHSPTPPRRAFEVSVRTRPRSEGVGQEAAPGGCLAIRTRPARERRGRTLMKAVVIAQLTVAINDGPLVTDAPLDALTAGLLPITRRAPMVRSIVIAVVPVPRPRLASASLVTG